MAYGDLKRLFDDATRSHPDLMEPFVTRLGDAEPSDHERIMREALATTVKDRYPLAKREEMA